MFIYILPVALVIVGKVHFLYATTFVICVY
jgi:hypothetical protein